MNTLSTQVVRGVRLVLWFLVFALVPAAGAGPTSTFSTKSHVRSVRAAGWHEAHGNKLGHTIDSGAGDRLLACGMAAEGGDEGAA